MRTLHLNLKKKWFFMTYNHEKREDYREITPYWIKRLIDINYPEEEKGKNKIIPENIFFDIQNGHDPVEVIKEYFSEFKKFDTVTFSNGYATDRLQIEKECTGIEIREGRPEWGAVKGKMYFVIKTRANIKFPINSYATRNILF